MSIIDTLITDRAAADVTRWRTLRDKGYAAMTAAEKTEWDAAMKGSYDYVDLNRVGNAVAYLAGLITGYGYTVTVNPKIDWTFGDEPTPAQLTAYLDDIAAIKAAFYGTTAIPTTLEGLTHTGANSIEQLLLEIEQHIDDMAAVFRYCGELICGE